MGLDEFERDVMAGRIGPETPIDLDGRWVSARGHPLWIRVRASTTMALKDAWDLPSVPWMTAILVGLMIRIFLWGNIATASRQWIEETLPKNAAAIVERGESWRLLTYALLHANLEHILSNLVFLAYCGVLLERLVGPWEILILFCGSAMAGSALSAIVSPEVVSVGASAGDFGFAAAAVVMGWRFADLLPTRAKRQFGAALGFYTVVVLVTSAGAKQVDSWAHLGGLVAGGAIAATWMPNITTLVVRNRGVRWAWAVALVAILFAIPAVGPRMLPMTPVTKDGITTSYPSWWTIGWTATGIRGWTSPLGDATVAVRTERTALAGDIDDALQSEITRSREIDPEARSNKIGLDRVEILFTAKDGGHRSVTRAFVRGRWAQAVTVDVPDDSTRLFRRLDVALADAVFDVPDAPKKALLGQSSSSWRVRAEAAAVANDLGDEPLFRKIWSSILGSTPANRTVIEAQLGAWSDAKCDDTVALAEQSVADFPGDRRILAAAAEARFAVGDGDRARAMIVGALLEAPGDRALMRAARVIGAQ